MLGSILGGSKSLMNLAEQGMGLIDKMHFSDEEKAKAMADANAKTQEQIVKWMEASQGQNVARRILALGVVGTWLLGRVCGFGATMLGYPAEAEQLHAMSESFDTEVMLVLTFYFSAGLISRVAPSLSSRARNAT